jgi:hypothetical protein
MMMPQIELIGRDGHLGRDRPLLPENPVIRGFSRLLLRQTPV